MFKENRKMLDIWYIISFTAISVGVLIGALYYAYSFMGSAEVKNYLDGYTNSLRTGMDIKSLISETMKTYFLLFICIEISAFFKFGPILSFFVLIRKGFVNSFTTSAIFDIYGMSGMLLSLSSIFQIIILIPVLAMFCSISVFRSQNRSELHKQDKIIYIIFSIIVFTTFCGCAILEGVLTTTFMKWIAFKVT